MDGYWYRVTSDGGRVLLETRDVDAAIVAAEACQRRTGRSAAVWQSDGWAVCAASVEEWTPVAMEDGAFPDDLLM